MRLRLASGFLLGILFVTVTMQSLPFVLFAFGVVHAVAQWEFTHLLAGLGRTRRYVHITLTTLVWIAISLALARRLPCELIPVALMSVMFAYAVLVVRRYEEGREYRHYISLLRSLLFITLPLAFVPVLVAWPAQFPYFLLLIASSWGADTAAIFAGRLAGHTPLAPHLSPKKTVEGVWGGLLCAGLIWAVAGWLYPLDGTYFAVSLSALTPGVRSVLMFAIGAALALVGIFGDLLFSLYKREEERKDYSSLIPGHGGFLDRFDSMLFVAPVLYLLCLSLPVTGG